MIPTPVDFFDPQTRNWRARLAISIEVMRELSEVASPLDMENVFVRRMNQLFPTDRQITVTRRGLVRPHYRITRSNQWKSSTDPWMKSDSFPLLSGGILGQLLYAEEPRVIDEIELDKDDPAYPHFKKQHSLLSIPLFERGEALTMLVLGRDEPFAFPPEQVPDLVWLSNLFSRAMQTTILSEALAKSYRQADFELKAIAELQSRLLPATIPETPGLDLAVDYRTAERAGGDLYDFFPLSNNRLGVLIADVSGHGSPAAMIMAILHSIAHHTSPEKPGEFMMLINDKLAARYTSDSGTFVTAFYAVIDPVNRTITYASAGHVPPRLLRGETGECVPLNKAQRLPLGIHPKASAYTQETIEFHPGDCVVMVTDGITEATDRHDDCFGLERLDAAMILSNGTALHRLASLRVALDAFTNGDVTKDDQTIVMIKQVEEQSSMVAGGGKWFMMNKRRTR